MNKTIIIIMVILIVAIYVYTFFIMRKRRKNEKKKPNTGNTYHYHSPYIRRTFSFNDDSDKTTRYNNYVTKYNSQEDYRELVPPKTKDKEDSAE